ncbi:hypothetical protein [uncultured Actinomyces sp.]|uniref:hypothetical protein n=1 Tax=uncultured Actinomyces sp. TaxID=249061 RepID=UPI002626FF63|nr:hypothetical protein [uncultured Actinomyces sp.]
MSSYRLSLGHLFTRPVATPTAAVNRCISLRWMGRIAALRETTVMHHACDIHRLRTGTVGRRR